MSVNIPIDEELLRKAMELSKATDPSALIRQLLEEEVAQRETAKHLIALGGTMPDFDLPPRHRSFERP